MTDKTAGSKLGMRRLSGWGGLSGLVLAGLVATSACNNPSPVPAEPGTTTIIFGRLTQSSVDKLDLLLVIDNSRSMADKQQILQLAVPDLIAHLVNPPCGATSSSGSFVPAPAADQPAGPLELCPVPGHKREFEPMLDIHVGLITSSLGGHGADACDAVQYPSENDHGHLISRLDAAGGGSVPTWQNLGFLAWDPCANSPFCEPKHSPPGESDVQSFVQRLTAMVIGAGEVGCGYEATLEAWYRFLIEPDPYLTIELQDTDPDPAVTDVNAVPLGTDSTLLQQRQDFLRPDSLLTIVMLSDENDCSIRDGGQHYLAAQISQPGSPTPFHLPPPQIACATNPNGPCCRSCAEPAPPGCPPKGAECNGALEPLEDQINLRCYDQKRRFGIDFLYPIDRYVTGLTSAMVQDRHGNLVPNPIFTDLNPNDAYSHVRDAGLVFLAGIVGVPWQDIARRNAAGNPDMLAGLDGSGRPVGGFQSAAELVLHHTWDLILGEPGGYISCSEGYGSCPADPLMIESYLPRSGTQPVTGEAIGLYPITNSVNGHERTIAQQNELQYACIFPLAFPRDCSDPGEIACECADAANDSPLCESAPGVFGTEQHYAKAFPGIRQLHTLQQLGDQGILGSICPPQRQNPAAADFGYRPPVRAMVDRLRVALRSQCLPRSLTPAPDGRVACVIIEAKHVGSSCDCSRYGRSPVKEENLRLIELAQADELAASQDWNCFCEIPQAADEDLTACQQDEGELVTNAAGEAVHGWCYIDAETNPPTGNPAIVATCPAGEQHVIRFLGAGEGDSGATLFIGCLAE